MRKPVSLPTPSCPSDCPLLPHKPHRIPPHPVHHFTIWPFLAGNQRSWSKRLVRYPKVLGSNPTSPQHTLRAFFPRLWRFKRKPNFFLFMAVADPPISLMCLERALDGLHQCHCQDPRVSINCHTITPPGLAFPDHPVHSPYQLEVSTLFFLPFLFHKICQCAGLQT